MTLRLDAPGPAFEWELGPRSHELGLPPEAAAGFVRVGHGLVAPARVRLVPVRRVDRADLFDAGVAGHKGIEDEALGQVVRDRARLDAIYFGNWQRDVSQVITPALFEYLGAAARPLSDLLFELLSVLGEATFGRRPTPPGLGTYRWWEHLDNPRRYGVAVRTEPYRPADRPTREERPEATTPRDFFWHEGPGAIPNYLHAGRDYVLRQLDAAAADGPNAASALEHFGNAMHVVEDMYAHSNFVELCLAHVDPRLDPKTGRDAGTGRPLHDSRRRWRLTTGVYLLKDTLVSLEKLLLGHLQGRPPGSPPSELGARLTRVLVRRLLGPDALAVYDGLQKAWQQTGIPAGLQVIWQQTGLPDLQRAFQAQIEYPIRSALARQLRPLADAAARQTGQEEFTISQAGRPPQRVIEISHSLLAKDDVSHPNHRMARQLAIIAVRDCWRELEAAWAQGRRQRGPDGLDPGFRRLVDRYLNHPQAAGDWWEPTVRGTPRGPSAAPRPGRRPGAPATRPLLRRGARGPAVRDLQQRLNVRLAGVPGYRPLVVDGIFGPRTQAAVQGFQRRHGLRPDGVVGPATWGRLGP